ncbi:hypothetical protein SteCoe_26168 [Stentor coeruleus]|uniref:Uncharacterized protein n=1 Tax=Stentor coeruleus TaxID=5963 RepID=A0A1R2BDJ8_9CILI|nr:hypothetical protein SteCoe_26168 [Stentor coeruleus]
MNAELLKLLVSLDRTAEKLASKQLQEKSFDDSFQKLASTSKTGPTMPKSSFEQNLNNINKQDRRARRTLRAKIHCILCSLPEPCKTLNKKHAKSLLKVKKQMLEELNEIRRKMNKDPINPDDFSLDDIFDKYGNVTKKPKILEAPLSPKSFLKQRLTKSELDMLKEDPVYFIQKEEYKYKIKLNDYESWEKLLDDEQPVDIPGILKTKSKVSKEIPSVFHTKKFADGRKERRLSEKIRIKLERAAKHKEDYKRKITEKIQNKMKSYSERTLKKLPYELSKDKFEKISSMSKITTYRNTSFSIDQNKKFDRVQEYLRKQKEINEKILNFKREARRAEDMYTNRLKEEALKEKARKARERLSNYSRKSNADIIDAPSERYIIKLG